MDAGGRPITAPDVMPKKMQKAIAAVVEPARDQRMRTSRDEIIWETMCILSGPVLSEKAAIVRRPIVDAPFMIVSSQKVWRGLEVDLSAWTGAREPLRVP